MEATRSVVTTTGPTQVRQNRQGQSIKKESNKKQTRQRKNSTERSKVSSKVLTEKEKQEKGQSFSSSILYLIVVRSCHWEFCIETLEGKETDRGGGACKDNFIDGSGETFGKID